MWVLWAGCAVGSIGIPVGGFRVVALDCLLGMVRNLYLGKAPASACTTGVHEIAICFAFPPSTSCSFGLSNDFLASIHMPLIVVWLPLLHPFLPYRRTL